MIYKAPTEFKAPELNFEDVPKYNKEIEDNTNHLKQFCIDRCVKGGKPTENVGEVIRFPVADGYAEYMVACMNPLQLIHLEYYDAYSFQYVHLLTKKEVTEKINQQKALKKIFG